MTEGALAVIEQYESLDFYVDGIKRDEEMVMEGAFGIGWKLRAIRDGFVYKERHETFEGFCKDELKYGRSHAHRLVDYVGHLDDLCVQFTTNVPNGDKTPKTPTLQYTKDDGSIVDVVASEGALRTLSYFDDGDVTGKREAWRRACACAELEGEGNPPSGKDVHRAVKEVKLERRLDEYDPEFDFGDWPILGEQGIQAKFVALICAEYVFLPSLDFRHREARRLIERTDELEPRVAWTKETDAEQIRDRVKADREIVNELRASGHEVAYKAWVADHYPRCPPPISAWVTHDERWGAPQYLAWIEGGKSITDPGHDIGRDLLSQIRGFYLTPDEAKSVIESEIAELREADRDCRPEYASFALGVVGGVGEVRHVAGLVPMWQYRRIKKRWRWERIEREYD